MKLFSKSAIAAACLFAGLGLAGTAMAFGPGMGEMGGDHSKMMGGESHHGMRGFGHGDPAKMQARMDKHLAELKTKLQITPAQESAWSAFIANMKPTAGGMMGMKHEDRQKMHEEMQKLTTPERIDRMKAMRAERMAQMDKRTDAVKALYTALSPEQRATFDKLHSKGSRHGMFEGRNGHGGKGAPAPAQAPASVAK